jgi:hypothetical protein
MQDAAPRQELPAPGKGPWSLRVLGGFRLTDQTGAEIALPSRLDEALLTYLVLGR